MTRGRPARFPHFRAMSRAAHTDIMGISEQVFDELVFWRRSAQRGLRVTVRSDGNSLLDSRRS